LSGNSNITPASAEDIEKAISAAQAKLALATLVLAVDTDILIKD